MATKRNMQNAKVVVIEDNVDILLSAQLLLKKQFTEVLTFENPEEAVSHLRFSQCDVVLLDMNFSKGETSGREGVHWLKKILQYRPGQVVIMITAYGDVELAIKALKYGALDFVLKPWDNDKLLSTIHAGIELSKSRKQIQSLEAKQQLLSDSLDQDHNEFIGISPAMQRIRSLIDKIAPTPANLLILGENGTGKEVVARAIHRQSNRNKEVFIKVDLGSIPETLFESELFGHKKGAFTDARDDRAGRFELASGGTLFLDEIGNLSMPMQSKLLTVLQNKKSIRVGSNEEVVLDIRLICATNYPLYEQSEKNEFRKDLLYRINTVEIIIPPLRERTEDIPLLIEHYLLVYGKKYQKTGIRIPRQLMKELQHYSWPGNVRELQHAVERAIILCENNQLNSGDFSLKSNSSAVPLYEKKETLTLDSVEKDAIVKALHKHKGNISHTAKELGLTRAALYRRMEKHGI